MRGLIKFHYFVDQNFFLVCWWGGELALKYLEFKDLDKKIQNDINVYKMLEKDINDSNILHIFH